MKHKEIEPSTNHQKICFSYKRLLFFVQSSHSLTLSVKNFETMDELVIEYLRPFRILAQTWLTNHSAVRYRPNSGIDKCGL